VQVEAGALGLLVRLLPAYGQALARQLDVAPPEPPHSYTCAAALDRWAEDQLPAVAVASPGIVGGSVEARGGLYSVVFGLVVGVYCSAATERDTHDLARLWAAAVRACMLQSPSLGGTVSDLVWLAESYDELAVEGRRSIAVCSVAFEARSDDVVDAYAGPLVAADPPDTDAWPTVQTTDVQIDATEEAP